MSVSECKVSTIFTDPYYKPFSVFGLPLCSSINFGPIYTFAYVRAGRNGLARISAQQPRRPSLNLPRGGPGPQPGPSIQKPEIAPAQLQRSSGKTLVIGRPILEGASIGEDRDGSLRQLTEAELPERIPELRLIQSSKYASTLGRPPILSCSHLQHLAYQNLNCWCYQAFYHSSLSLFQ